MGREGTSVSDDPSSTFVLKSFVTPSEGSSAIAVSESSHEASPLFQDAVSNISGSRQGEQTTTIQDTERIQDAALPLEYSASDTVESKEVSLISTDSGSSMDEVDLSDGPNVEPPSPAFSLLTNTGARNGPNVEPPSPAFSLLTNTGARDFRAVDSPEAVLHKSLSPPNEEEEEDSHEFKIEPKPSSAAPSTNENSDSQDVENSDSQDDNDSDADSIREQVEVRWLPDLAVEHSFRAPTPRKAWGSSSVTPVDRIPYVHGSYASAAPLMVYNRKWMRILRRLMPANHADAMEILREAEEAHARRSNNDQQMARLMKWAENNPVVAAYGVMNSNTGTDSSRREKRSMGRGSRRKKSRDRYGKTSSSDDRNGAPVLEWDIWLDPTLVKKVEAAMDVAEHFQNDENADYQDQIAANIEVDRQVGRLINRMMLAHGSASHLVSEALGVGSQYNFTKLVEKSESQRFYRRKESEKKWKKSGLHFARNGMDLGGKAWIVREQAQAALMNFDSHRRSVIAGKASAKPAGIFVERWLTLFLRALHIAKAMEGDLPYGHFYLEDDESTPQIEPEADKTTPPGCGLFLCLGIEDPNAAKVDHAKTSMAVSAEQIEESLGSPLRVILDLKSRRVPARVWARVIDNMRSRGIVIEGLGSFDVDELRSIGGLCASDVTEVRFFHSAGDLQKACHAKEVGRFSLGRPH